MSDLLATIGGIPVRRFGLAFRWVGGLAVDADGAPDAYAPPGSGLTGRDYLGNAGRPGDWWGLVTDDGTPHGSPVVQGAGDACPGYYVSPTALVSRVVSNQRDPRRYVDSSRVPYLAVPPELRTLGVGLGDVALVEYRDQWSPAIVADVGPRGKIGEGSIALARALGIDPSPKHGGCGAGVTCTVWPGTAGHPPWPREVADVLAQVQGLRGGLPVG